MNALDKIKASAIAFGIDAHEKGFDRDQVRDSIVAMLDHLIEPEAVIPGPLGKLAEALSDAAIDRAVGELIDCVYDEEKRTELFDRLQDGGSRIRERIQANRARRKARRAARAKKN